MLKMLYALWYLTCASYVYVSALEGQKRALEPLELALHIMLVI